jgi:ABC-type transport system involved in multi-copper enzyme maturation permease subunit
VAGKWLGAFLFVLTLLALTLIFPIILNNYVSPGIDLRVLLSSYLGVILVCAALLALGVGISAIFTNQFELSQSFQSFFADSEQRYG